MDKTSNKKLDITTLIIKIIYISCYVLVFGYLIWALIDLSIQHNNMDGDKFDATPIGYAFVVVVLGSIAAGVVSVVGLIGLIVNEFNKYSPKRVLNRIIHIGFVLLPIITQTTIILIGQSIFGAN